MGIRIFNTYSRQLESFEPLQAGSNQVKMYTCGPTVYNYAHIGNFRAYIFEDLLQRHLEARGFKVERVMNLTDVDDKTIRNSRLAGRRLADFTQVYKDAFFTDIDTLRIKRADHYPAATEDRYIVRMIAMIAQLEHQGMAYQAEDGSVYFRLSTFPEYGRLAHLNLEELRPSGRVSSDEYEKENVGDFALWKAWDASDGEVWWNSPWGKGRPGWHIECSAMATELLGPELDIHCGGVDNIFPHHEAEIAQSECCTGRKFVRYWLHCAHLMVEGQKMSKSLGNFYTLRDLLEKGFTGREIRFALITVNYRLPCNFTLGGIEDARAALSRVDAWTQRLEAHSHASAPQPTPLSSHVDAFFDDLDDDLNVSGAMGHLFDLIRESNRALDGGTLSASQAAQILEGWGRINQVLVFDRDASVIPAEVEALLQERQRARESKNWPQSDQIRDRLAELGWNVKDSKDGQKLTPR